MDLNISFKEDECDRIFTQMQDLMSEVKKAYAIILAAKDAEASQWKGDSGETFKARMAMLSERLEQLEVRWQNLLSRYERARSCVARLNEMDFS
ncbi:MAG: hypothetical protein IJS08_02650 [Victivallales bacterium]|nr:hypothetical protein [Victivallales bacterium]